MNGQQGFFQRKAVAFAFILCACIALLTLSACGKEASVTDVDYQAGKPAFQADITIECEENLIFSKYDVDVIVDGETEGLIDHGQTKTFNLRLPVGSHTLKLVESGGGADGNVDFELNADSSFKFKIKCTSDQIEIEEIPSLNPPINAEEVTSKYHDELRKAFEEAGFTNISEVELRDLSPDQRDSNWLASKVSVAGSESFTTEDSFVSDVEVIITHNVLADLTAPAASSDLAGKPYEGVVSLFENAGFINVVPSPVSDYAPEGATTEVVIGGIFGESSFTDQDAFAFDAGVEAKYLMPEARTTSARLMPWAFSSSNR